MSDRSPSESQVSELNENFGDVLSQYEKSQRKPERAKQSEGVVVAISGDSIFVDVGLKSEGILPLVALQGEDVKVGDKVVVSVKGRNPEGYYELSRGKVQRTTDWPSLEQAFAEKATILGTVTGVVKGGLSVDVGVRAFMPASRSGTRAAAEMEKLVGEEIRCRIIKLDVADEDVVVDRRAVIEEEERAGKERRVSQLKEGERVSGTVRSLTDYGAFVDIGGVDALLHVGEMAWTRVSKPSDVVSVGQQVDVVILKISSEGEKRRISVGLKQLQADPWSEAAEKYKVGERVRGTVTRTTDFGAFVELEPGVEGLIHISEMSWGKKVKRASDVVKPGETVEAVVLGVSAGERRISLGLKQALGDPWVDAAQKFAPGTVVEGPVTNLTKFGAFVQLTEGIEGMIHISDLTAEKRLNHPQEAVKVGQVVKAQVLAVDKEKRQLRLGMKQLVPSGLDEYIAEHKKGDFVSGRVVDEAGGQMRVELGEGIQAVCRITSTATAGKEAAKPAAKADISALSSMLSARWKGGTGAATTKPEDVRAGQVRTFRITSLDPSSKKIELELA
ncbi:MAG TPA: 30S ribosomal protein S1 [Terriglobales bacterium]|nr:30S ribosomal protein S1 [Terriglobales bacterium]